MVGVIGVEDCLISLDLDEGIRTPSGEGIGVGCGTIPATMQSSWKTAVISTRRGGRLAVDASLFCRGLALIRATLMKPAQATSKVESSCQWREHLKRSARGESVGRSM